MAATEQNKFIVRRFWEEVFNGRKLTLIDELFTTDWVYHGVAGRKLYGQEGLKQFLTMYHNAFPDIQVKVENLIAEGDKSFHCRIHLLKMVSFSVGKLFNRPSLVFPPSSSGEL